MRTFLPLSKALGPGLTSGVRLKSFLPLLIALAGLSCGGYEPDAAQAPAPAAPVELRVETLSPSTRESESVLIGSTPGDNRLGDAFDFRLLGIFRGGEEIESRASEVVLEAGDLLLVQGSDEDLELLRGLQQLEILEESASYLDVLEDGELDLVEVTLHPHSRLGGKSIAELKLSERYRVRVAGIWRDGEAHRSSLGSMTVQRGDALLIVGPRHRLAALESDDDLIVLNPVLAKPIDSTKAPLAATLMAVVVGSVLFGLLPIAIAAIAGATLMVLTRCLTMEQAYRAIDWRSIFLIAGMLPLGAALQQSGAAGYVAHGILSRLGEHGPWPILAGIYGVTAVTTLMVPTVVSVLLMAPIAFSVSAEMGIPPHTVMMTVAMATSASLASPLSHPANVLVMGPGGYRFVDYLKLGLPLAVMSLLVTMVLLPVFWPLQ